MKAACNSAFPNSTGPAAHMRPADIEKKPNTRAAQKHRRAPCRPPNDFRMTTTPVVHIVHPLVRKNQIGFLNCRDFGLHGAS